MSTILGREFGRRHLRLSFFRPRSPGAPGGMHVPWKRVEPAKGIGDLEPNWDFGEADLIEVLKDWDNIASVSRHGMVIRPSTIDLMAEAGHAYRILPVFFLRKFQPWHVSLYHQQRGDPEYMVRASSDPELIVAKTGTLREYTEFCVGSLDSHRRHKAMYNWTADDVSAMLDRIELYQVGLVERYDESLVVMEDALRGDFPELDLSYGSPLNVRRLHGHGTPDQAGRGLEDLLGDDLASRLTAMGAHSDDLYVRMERELDSRVSCIPGFGDKLDDFRRRCMNRRDAAGQAGRIST